MCQQMYYADRQKQCKQLKELRASGARGRNMDNLAALPFREKLSAHITLMKNKIFLKQILKIRVKIDTDQAGCTFF